MSQKKEKKIMINNYLERQLSCKCSENNRLNAIFPTKLAIKILTHGSFYDLFPQALTASSIALQNLLEVLLNEKNLQGYSDIREQHPALMSVAAQENLIKSMHEFEEEPLEQNSFLVTERETWLAKMNAIFEHLQIKGEDGKLKTCTATWSGREKSVKEMTQELYDALTHEKPAWAHDGLPKAIIAAFKWITMHCFAVRELYIRPEGERDMKQFALAYLDQEKTACEEAQRAGQQMHE